MKENDPDCICCGCTLWEHYDALAVDAPVLDMVTLSHYPTPPASYQNGVAYLSGEYISRDNGTGSQLWEVMQDITVEENVNFASIVGKLISHGYIDSAESTHRLRVRSDEGLGFYSRMVRVAVRFDVSVIDTADVVAANLYWTFVGLDPSQTEVSVFGYGVNQPLPTNAAEFASQSGSLGEVTFTGSGVGSSNGEQRVDVHDDFGAPGSASTLTVYFEAHDFGGMKFRSPRLRLKLNTPAWRVVGEELPGSSLSEEGLYALVFRPHWSGDALPITPTCKARLLKADDSVFAEWNIASTFKPASGESGFIEDSSTFSLDWNDGGTIVNDQKSEGVALTSLVDVPWRYHIVGVRPQGSIFIFGDYFSPESVPVDDPLLPDPVGLWSISDGDDPFFNWSPYYDESVIPRTGVERNHYADPDSSLPSFRSSVGFPLPLGETDLLDAGPLRLSLYEPGGNTTRIEAIATKIYQESIESSDESPDCASQPQKNVSCPWPVISPVTNPTYMTARWGILEIDGGSVSLNSNEYFSIVGKSGNSSGGAIASIVGHMRPGVSPYHYNRLGLESDSTATHISTRFNSYYAPYPGSPAFSGHYAYDLDDEVLAFDDQYSGTDQSMFNWTYSGGPVLDPASYTKNGSGPTPRQDDFPFYLKTIVLATSDPCVWRVNAHLIVRAWIGETIDFQFYPQVDPGVKAFVITPQNPLGMDSGEWKADFLSRTFEWSQDVPAWRGLPPVVEFDSDHLVSGTGHDVPINIVTGWETELLTGFEVEVRQSSIELDPADITFKIGPHPNTKIPHPS